jgi:hypothetical protein
MGDVDGILALITDDAEWNVYGSVFNANAEVHVRGRDAIRERYTSMRDRMIRESDNSESVVECLMVDDWGIGGFSTGRLRGQGRVFAMLGHHVDDESDFYVMTNKVAYFRGYRGELACQMNYFTTAPSFEKL